jgi:hypothetical protein
MAKLWTKRKLRWVMEIINESDPCTDWPNCDCQRMLDYWERMLREREAGIPPRHPTDRNWEFAKKCVLQALTCIWTQCWDAGARREAFAQLCQPMFRKMLDPNDWPAAKPSAVGWPWQKKPEPEPEPESGWSLARSREFRARAKAKQEAKHE